MRPAHLAVRMCSAHHRNAQLTNNCDTRPNVLVMVLCSSQTLIWRRRALAGRVRGWRPHDVQLDSAPIADDHATSLRLAKLPRDWLVRLSLCGSKGIKSTRRRAFVIATSSGHTELPRRVATRATPW